MANHVLNAAEQSVERPCADSGPKLAGNDFTHQCTETTLDVKGTYGLTASPSGFVRVSPAAR